MENRKEQDFRTQILSSLRERKHRQKPLEKILSDYQTLAEQLSAVRSLNQKLRNTTPSGEPSGEAGTSGEQCSQQVTQLQAELGQLYKQKALNDQKLIDANHNLQKKQQECDALSRSEQGYQEQVQLLRQANSNLEARLAQLEKANQLIRDEYLALQATYNGMEAKNKQLVQENQQLIDRWIEFKNKQVDEFNAKIDVEEQKRTSAHYQKMQEAVDKELNVPVFDGNRLDMLQPNASVGGNVQGHIVDMLPDKCAFRFSAHENGEASSAKWSPTTFMLATGGTDRKLQLWQIHRAKQNKQNTLMGCNQSITSLDFDADEKFVICSSNDMNVRLWTLADQRLRDVLTGHTGKVSAARFRSNCTEIVSGSHDRTIKLWDVRNRRCVKTYFGNPASTVLDLVTNDGAGASVISGHFDKSVRFWDTRASDCSQTIELDGRVTSLSLSVDAQYLLCSTRNDSLLMLDLRMNQKLHTYCAEGFHVGYDTCRAALSPGGMYCAAGSSEGRLFVWNVQTTAVERHLADKKCVDDIVCVQWHPMGWQVAGCDRQGNVCIWSD